MKTDILVLVREWIATRDVLLDRYVRETGEVLYSEFFVTRIEMITRNFKGLHDGVNLDNINPYNVGTSYFIFAEIQAMYRIIDRMPSMLNDLYTARDSFRKGECHEICKSERMYE